MPNYKQHVAQIFNGVVNKYNTAAIIEYEIGARLLNRLELINIMPESILDLGAGTGHLTFQLAHRYKNAQLFHLDIAIGMVEYARSSFKHGYPFSLICGDMEYIPFQDNSVDFVFSNCVFQWCQNPTQLFQEIHRILKPEGLFLFSTFGPDTLIELQRCIDSIPHQTHHPLFIDMHTIGDILLNTNFQDPVMDVDMLTVTYPTLPSLINDLNGTGSSEYYDEISLNKNTAITLQTHYLNLIKKYESFRIDDELPATFEIIYGHAWGSKKRKDGITEYDNDIYRIPTSEIGYK